MCGGPYPAVFIEGFKSTVPFLVFPVKLIISFPFVYHTLGGRDETLKRTP